MWTMVMPLHRNYQFLSSAAGLRLLQHEGNGRQVMALPIESRFVCYFYHWGSRLGYTTIVMNEWGEVETSMGESVLRIGASGHQQLGDDATIEFVFYQLRELLLAYQKQA